MSHELDKTLLVREPLGTSRETCLRHGDGDNTSEVNAGIRKRLQEEEIHTQNFRAGVGGESSILRIWTIKDTIVWKRRRNTNIW